MKRIAFFWLQRTISCGLQICCELKSSLKVCGFTSESNSIPLLYEHMKSFIITVFTCFIVLLVNYSHRALQVRVPLVCFLFLESPFLFLSPHSYLLHLSLPLSFVYSGEGGAQDQREEDWMVMSSCSFTLHTTRKLDGEDKRHKSNSTNLANC